MTKRAKPKRSRFLKRIQHQLMIYALRILVSIFRRRLELKFLYVPDRVLLSGNLLAIRWEVKGCYKITINKTITLPGHINSIWLNSAHLPEELTLEFFGKDATIQKTLILPEAHVIQLKSIQLRRLSLSLNTKHLSRHIRIAHLSFVNRLTSPQCVRINNPSSIFLKPISLPSLTFQIPNYEKTIL